MFQLLDLLPDLEILIDQVKDQVLMKGKVWHCLDHLEPSLLNVFLSLLLN